MPPVRVLGEMIKFLRTRRGWLQKELAKRAGLTKGMVSGYETGKKTPTLKSLTRIAEALQADFCDLHCAFEHVHGRPMEVHELSPHFRHAQARSSRSSSTQPADADLPAGTAEAAPGAADSGPRPADDLDRVLSNFTTSATEVLRFFIRR